MFKNKLIDELDSEEEYHMGERCESCGAIFEIDGPTAWCEDPTGCGAHTEEEQGLDDDSFDEDQELDFED